MTPSQPITEAATPLQRAEAMLADEEPPSEEELRAERDHYLFSAHVGHKAELAHKADDGAFDELFKLIEETGFLADQAAYFDGFQPGSRDVETHVLPAAVIRKNWPRFLHLALLAANLRGLADALADEAILAALVRHGRRRLALDIAAQLADPATRAEARAVIAATEPKAADFSQLLQTLERDLDAVPPPADEETAEAWRTSLVSVARHLGPQLRARWPGWIGRLQKFGDRGQQVWEAVADSCLQADRWAEAGLRQALEAMDDHQRLLAFLPPRLAAAAPRRSWTILDLLERSPLGEDERLRWHARIAVLARQARGVTGPDRSAWQHLAGQPLPWSVELVEIGRALWPKLDEEQIAALERSIDERIEGDADRKTVRAALRVVVLKENPSAIAAERVLAAVQAIPPEKPAHLHWSLRYLAAQRDGPKELRQVAELRRQVAVVARYLFETRYDAPAKDLACFLDLVAEHLPKELERQVENVIWSPVSTPDTLRILASRARERRVLTHLLECVESYAAAVSEDESTGFELRRELLIRLACRLALGERDLASVHQAAERLLPEEEDDLRFAVAAALVAPTPDDAQPAVLPLEERRQLAQQVCEGIRSRRLELLTRLRITADKAALKSLLAPGALYRAVATTEAIDDERHALAALLEVPTTPEDLARTHLSQVRDGDRRILGLLDLARHGLAYQRQAYRRPMRDRIAALQPLSRAVGGMASDEHLVAITPELAEAGSERGMTRAVAELQEAFLRLVGQTTVAWPRRREAIETLLVRLGPVLVGGEDKRGREFLTRCRALASLLRWLVQLPAERATEGVEELREHWHEVLPLVVAAGEQLASPVRWYLHYPLGAWIILETLRWVTEFLDPELRRAACARLEEWLAPRWLRRAPTPWTEPASVLLAHWSWLKPHQYPAVHLSCATPEERRHQAERLLQQAAASSEKPEQTAASREALIQLLARDQPALVAGLLRQLPGAERQVRSLRLLRHRWVAKGSVSAVARLLADKPMRWRARLWFGSDDQTPGDETPTTPTEQKKWLKAVAALAARGELDPRDPSNAPLRRCLWEIDPELSGPALAGATVGALEVGGIAAAEDALRLWLHAYLSSRPGQEHPPGRQRSAELEAPIHRARSIPESAGAG